MTTQSATCGLRAILSTVSGGHGDFAVVSKRTTRARQFSAVILSACTVERGLKALEVFDSTCKTLLQELVTTSLTSTSYSLMKERLYRDFHRLRQEKLVNVWHKFLSDICLSDTDSATADPLLMQYVFEQSFEHFIRTTFLVATSTEEENITEAELNALRYAAGYVPRALITRLSRESRPLPSKQDFIACLRGMAEDESSVQDGTLFYTKRWTNAVDRGGLFKVKDDVYQFFVELEKKLCKELKLMLQRRKVDKSSVLTSLVNDDVLTFHWCALSLSIDDESAKKELLTMVVDLWLTIRGFSTAGAYVEYYKQCTKKSTKKSSSLRKSLKQVHNHHTEEAQDF